MILVEGRNWNNSITKPKTWLHGLVQQPASSGGLKLSGKAERYPRFKQRKLRNPKARIKKISVLTDNPEWMPWTKFPYKMLQKRYQSLLIKYLKEQIDRNINSENQDQELMVFSDPAITKTFLMILRRSIKMASLFTLLRNGRILN